MVVEVIFPIALRGSFDYQLPEEFQKKSFIGYRVIAPWRAGYKEGVITSYKDQSLIQNLKKISTVLDDFPIVSKDFLFFTKWIAQYYFSSWGELVFLAIPKSARIKINKADHNLSINPLSKNFTEVIYTGSTSCKASFKKNSQKQKLLELIATQKNLSKEQILKFFPKASSHLAALVQLGFLEKKQKKLEVAVETLNIPKQAPVILNEAQQQIIKKFHIQKKFQISLLHGVNASGKTEVYIFLIWKALQQKKSVLFLVPEIALTPQTKNRIAEYFPKLVVVWHSRLSPPKKLAAWLKIKHQAPCLVLGTRSALFAPIQNLGLIVIDEEHDSSFHQIENPVYNARNCACKLAQLQNIPLVLGSATPAIESYHNAKLGKYNLVSLMKKHQKSYPPVTQMVDLKIAPKYNGIYYFSQALQQEIAKTISKNQQTILFLNRKGFASLVSCKFCKSIFQCPRCSVAITWHSSEKQLLCHYCLYAIKENFVCKTCQKKNFSLLGIGTEKIEQLLCSIFPEARILKLDSDSFSNTATLESHLKKIQNHEVDIIIGTQIIAKGHHFPKVTLCGVLLADAGFQRPDYRCTEKTFQLLSQLVGRAGREKFQVGKTIVQSYQPDSQLIQYAVKQNFTDFYHYEIEKRKNLQQPPTTHWILLKVSSKKENIAREKTKELCLLLQKESWEKIELLGPIPATPYKLNDWFNWEIVLQSKSIKILRQLFHKDLVANFERHFREVKIKIIVDP